MRKSIWIAVALAALVALPFLLMGPGRLLARVTTAGSTDIFCVGPSGAEVCVDSSGNFLATTDNDADLGTSSLEWKDLYVDGTGYIDTATVDTLTATTSNLTTIVCSSCVTHSTIHDNIENVADVTLTSIQVANLFTAPQTLVDSPGAGYATIVEGVILHYDYSEAFSGIAAGEDLIVSYTNNSGRQVTRIETTGFIDQSADEARYAYPHASTSGSVEGSFEPVQDAPIVIGMATGDVTTGWSQLKIRTIFRRIPTGL